MSKEDREAEKAAKAAAKAEAEAKAKAEAEAKAAGAAPAASASIPMEEMPESPEEIAAKQKAAREMPVNGRAVYDYRYCHECIYVENDGEEYPARILPLPVNKGELSEVPAIKDPLKDMVKIQKLPAARRVKAMLEYNKRLQETVPCLLIKGEEVRLCRYKGLLFPAIEIADKEFPAANLMVNFSHKTGGENWCPKNGVRPKECVPHGLPSGMVPHFYIPEA